MFYGIEDGSAGSAAQEWHTYLLQRAEQERRARRVLIHQRRWSGAALIWLGHRLSSWGHYLQRRHNGVYEVIDGFTDPAVWRPM